MSDAKVFWAVKTTLGGFTRWASAKTTIERDKSARRLMHRQEALHVASLWDESKLVKVTRRPRPKAVERLACAGIAVARTVRDYAFVAGTGCNGPAIDGWISSKAGKRVRVTLEVLA